jgi:hypothetical protein
MGQQQLLLIILGVIMVGIAVTIGITMFMGQSIRVNEDNLMNDMNIISSDAYAYFMRAKMMGGGAGAYHGYRLAESFRSMADGTITETVASDGTSVTFVATSKYGYGTITTTVLADGTRAAYVFTGDFR